MNTIFFGNGISICDGSNTSWESLLTEISGLDKDTIKAIPYTTTYEIALSRCREKGESEASLKEKIAEMLRNPKAGEMHNALAELGAENYITTNYDSAICKSLESIGYTRASEDKSEKLYSIRRHKRYESADRETKIWNIHGDTEAPKSIMLGLDHYCGSIGKISAYIKGFYHRTTTNTRNEIPPIKKKIENQDFCNTSWIDLFFTSDIHFIGFGLDFSETDIWWAINRWARYKVTDNLTNNITFHCIDLDKEPQKRKALEGLGVTIKEFRTTGENRFKNANLMAIEHIIKQQES